MRLHRVDNGVGFNQGDMIVISEPPKDCSILQLSRMRKQPACRMSTAPGTSWDLAA
jgi:hypothetical protein